MKFCVYITQSLSQIFVKTVDAASEEEAKRKVDQLIASDPDNLQFESEYPIEGLVVDRAVKVDDKGCIID